MLFNVRIKGGETGDDQPPIKAATAQVPEGNVRVKRSVTSRGVKVIRDFLSWDSMSRVLLHARHSSAKNRAGDSSRNLTPRVLTYHTAGCCGHGALCRWIRSDWHYNSNAARL